MNDRAVADDDDERLHPDIAAHAVLGVDRAADDPSDPRARDRAAPVSLGRCAGEAEDGTVWIEERSREVVLNDLLIVGGVGAGIGSSDLIVGWRRSARCC